MLMSERSQTLQVFLHPNAFCFTELNFFSKTPMTQKMCPDSQKIACSTVTVFTKLCLPKWNSFRRHCLMTSTISLHCVIFREVSIGNMNVARSERYDVHFINISSHWRIFLKPLKECHRFHIREQG